MTAIALDDSRSILDLDGEKMRVAKGESQHGGQVGRFRARAEQPHFRHRALTRSGVHCRKGVLRLQVVGQIPQQVRHLIWEIANVAWPPWVSQSRSSELIAPWRAPKAQINPARIQRLQETKLLRHLERTVVGQHHAAAAYAYAPGMRRDLPDQNL